MLARRNFLRFATALGLLSGAGIGCWSDSYAQPTKLGRIRIIAPGAAGGGFDETARSCEKALVASGLIESAQIINIPGAGGTVGLVKFVEQYRGRHDALLVSGSTMLSSIIVNKTPIDFGAATPLARLFGTANAIVVPAASRYKTIDDLVAVFKADPGSISWAGGSIGGGDHMIAAMFAKTVGVDPKRLNYVAFAGGGEMLASVLGGHVTMASSAWAEVSEQIRAGQLRCLGVTADKDEPGVDAPTLRSQGIDVAFYTWRALLAAPRISNAERANLLDVVAAMIGSPTWKAEAARQGWTDFYLAGDDFVKFVDGERQTARTLLADLGLA